MLKLKQPDISYKKVLDACACGISPSRSRSLKQKLASARPQLEEAIREYTSLASEGKLYTINYDPTLAVPLKKEDLIKLYDRYFVPKEKPARQFYDKLISAVSDRCPYCGISTQVANLDHYLPKSHYPQFSIFPGNLIPSCGVCNKDKGSKCAQSEAEQVIHPYFDDPCFFEEQWLFAEYKIGETNEPAFFKYYVSPPPSWTSEKKNRVHTHFERFDLKRRFAVQAASKAAGICDIYRFFEQKIPMDPNQKQEFFGDYISAIDNNNYASVNHWERVMFAALKESNLF